MTSPMPRYRQPHSPELSSNLDCAFPAFPTSNARRPSTAGGSKKSAAPHKDEMFGRSPRSVFSEPESMTETSGTEVDSAVGLDRNSPLYGGQQSYQMNRQASGGDSRPGPTQSFGVGRRPSREGTQQNPATVFPLREARPASPSFNSQVPAPYARSAAPGSPMNPKSRAAPSRPQRPANVDNFLAKLKTDPVQDSNPSVEYLAQGVRSNTFPRPREPRPTHGETSQRRPSEPAYAVQRPPMPHSAKSMPTRDNHMPPVPLRSQTMQSSRSPPRSSSRNGMRSASNDQIVQPPPSTQQMPGMTRAETEHITHASSDSASSTSSAVSAGNSSTRSHISPSSSVSVPSTQDHSPALSSPDPGLYPNDSKNQLYGYEHGLGVTMAPVQEVPQWSPPSRPYATLAAPSTKRGDTRNFTPPQQFPVEHPESPMDPALQRGIVRQPSAPDDFSFTALQTQPSVPQQRSDNVLARSDPTTERRPGTGSKHICRGCNEKIVGRSIKAQDGRLTGRYHRQCKSHPSFPSCHHYSQLTISHRLRLQNLPRDLCHRRLLRPQQRPLLRTPLPPSEQQSLHLLRPRHRGSIPRNPTGQQIPPQLPHLLDLQNSTQRRLLRNLGQGVLRTSRFCRCKGPAR